MSMKHLLLATIAAVLVVGCGESQPPERPTAKPPDISIREAVKTGNIEAVKQHLVAGTEVDPKVEDGRTPLLYATANGHKEIVLLLLANGADVNAGCPSYMIPTLSGEEVYDNNIDNLADIVVDEEEEDMKLLTPLHLAVEHGHKEIAELLINKGSDVNAKVVSGPLQGSTPLDWAINFNHTETADLLRKHGGKTKKELEAAGN